MAQPDRRNPKAADSTSPARRFRRRAGDWKWRFPIGALLIGLVGFFVVQRLHLAVGPTLPHDMPRNSRFVKTGFDIDQNQPLGEWIACRPNPDAPTDWCRVTDQGGKVVFEGQFLAIDSGQPVPADRLQVAAIDEDHLWIAGPAEQAPVPAIRLEDGQVLVPDGDQPVLAERGGMQGAPYLTLATGRP